MKKDCDFRFFLYIFANEISRISNIRKNKNKLKKRRVNSPITFTQLLETKIGEKLITNKNKKI